MTQRRYTEEYRASALALLDANAGNAKKTAAELGISRRTLRDWYVRANEHSPTETHQDARETLQETIDRLLYKILGAMETKIDTATYRELYTSAGILSDKSIALRTLEAKSDEPAELTDDERVTRLALWIDAAREKTP
jgi:transposase-like protein